MPDAIFRLHTGKTPLLLSLPHVGTVIPESMHMQFSARALEVEDTDWHLERAYDFAAALGASVIVPRYSRYVIDLNRPPDNTPMYPGASNTELCPSRFFTGEPLYPEKSAPTAREIDARRETYWQPYHDALCAELQRLRDIHGYAILWDGHSIRSQIPWLFDGQLPDLNLGTASGASCAPSLRDTVAQTLAAQSTFSVAVDGRFKGGYITRHYGQPAQSIHALQLEMCQYLYMEETRPFNFDPKRAARLQPLLQQLLEVLLKWRPDHVANV